MQYENPASLDAALARNSATILEEFRALTEMNWRNKSGKACLFCNYGAIDPADKARILFETPDFLLVDRPYAFDLAVNRSRKKNAGMSFLHVLVLPKHHIACAVAIPDPALIDHMKAVWWAYLDAHASPQTETIVLPGGLSVSIKQTSGMLALIKREWAKLAAQLAQPDVLVDLELIKLTPMDITRHFADHARALSGVDIRRDDFSCFFHVPPSIWHLHMHVALRDEAFRTHCVGYLDDFSIAADTVGEELVRMRKAMAIEGS